MSIIDTLVFDRTAADVQLARALLVKGWPNMTQEERSAFLAGLKGAYNASDLNRVESAADYLAGRLHGLPELLLAYGAALGVAPDVFFGVPYDPEAYGLTVKTDWSRSDLPTPEQMERYLANVAALRGALTYDTDPLPERMDSLTAEGANAIERSLAGLDSAVSALQATREAQMDKTASAWMYSGEIFANEV